jgi:ABC-2 type transport system ATP-binding protein
MRKRGARLSLNTDEPPAIAALLRRLLDDGFAVTDFHRESRRLEDAFVDIIKRGQAPRPPPPPLPPLPSLNS